MEYFFGIGNGIGIFAFFHPLVKIYYLQNREFSRFFLPILSSLLMAILSSSIRLIYQNFPFSISRSISSDGGSGLLTPAGIGARRASTPDPTQNLRSLLAKQKKFLESLKEEKVFSFLSAVAQLCHMDTNLANGTWIQLFPRLWKILTEKQQNVLASELTPFITSGAHVVPEGLPAVCHWDLCGGHCSLPTADPDKACGL